MKHLLTALLLFVLSIGAMAQDTDEMPRNEFKVNGFYLILGLLEVDYEYIINDESSIGVTAGVALDNIAYKWGIIPHYKLFFGKKAAQGFFVEGNAALLKYDGAVLFFGNNGFGLVEENEIFGGLGISVGGKFKTKRNVVVELVAGVGRTIGSETQDAYPRFGINIGKRF